MHLLSRSTELVLRLFGIKPLRETSVTEEEIKLMIEQGTQEGRVRTHRAGDGRARVPPGRPHRERPHDAAAGCGLAGPGRALRGDPAQDHGRQPHPLPGRRRPDRQHHRTW
ncbi:MAG: DUF21 domain-containing protein [Desulfomicrobium escambiense]|nr:DUF21 domain-containing protein [Desulfomicrobium escambiense]